MASSLYVHIPFCAHICHYCDFSKVIYDEKWAFLYLEQLKKEISSYEIKEKLKTIYVGGGTPTCLNKEILEDLLIFLEPLLEKNGEFTVEANPENLTSEKVSILKTHGVNRVSLGMESSIEKFLLLMGRKHTYDDVKKAIETLRSNEISNISVDLIYALPGETIEDLKKDVKALLSLEAPHLSAYSLTINEGTSFHKMDFKESDDETEAEMYELILNSLRKSGYERYEVSNFAKRGFYSKHNLTYWHDDEYYGAGLGASGFLKGVRYTNVRNLSKYLRGEYHAEEEVLDEKSKLEDYFLTNLRLSKGFSKSDFEKRFGYPFQSKYSKELEKLKKAGLLAENSQSIYPTDKGLILLDRVLLEFF